MFMNNTSHFYVNVNEGKKKKWKEGEIKTKGNGS